MIGAFAPWRSENTTNTDIMYVRIHVFLESWFTNMLQCTNLMLLMKKKMSNNRFRGETEWKHLTPCTFLMYWPCLSLIPFRVDETLPSTVLHLSDFQKNHAAFLPETMTDNTCVSYKGAYIFTISQGQMSEEELYQLLGEGQSAEDIPPDRFSFYFLDYIILSKEEILKF